MSRTLSRPIYRIDCAASLDRGRQPQSSGHPADDCALDQGLGHDDKEDEIAISQRDPDIGSIGSRTILAFENW